MIWFTAWAQEAPDQDLADEISEEIIVWKRLFARFDDKRWLVRTEVITPAVTPLGTVKTPIRANAWQLEVVVHCRLADHRKRLREADCEVEDAALRIHGRSPRPFIWSSPRTTLAAKAGSPTTSPCC